MIEPSNDAGHEGVSAGRTVGIEVTAVQAELGAPLFVEVPAECDSVVDVVVEQPVVIDEGLADKRCQKPLTDLVAPRQR